MKYNAFISYNKAADHELAPAVRKALEQFAKPVFKRKALSVFLDSSSLAATPDLWNSIQNGLEESEYCIFLASPGSAKSPWCIKELLYWKEKKDSNKLLLIWTHGDIKWDHTSNDFNWETTTAFPIELKGIFKNEPLYIDAREQYAKDQFTLNNPTFKNYIGMLAAPMHGKPLEDLIDEDIKQFKKTIRLRNGAIAVLGALLLASIGLSVYAFKERAAAALSQKKAEENGARAIKVANEALIKSYLADSKSNTKNDPTMAMKLAVFGYQFAKANAVPTIDLEDQLILAFNNTTHFYTNHKSIAIINDSTFPFQVIKAFEGNKLYLEDENNLIIETDKGNQIGISDFQGPITAYSFTPGGKWIVLTSLNRSYARNVGQKIALYDLKGIKIAEFENLQPAPPPGVRVSDNGKRILISAQNETALINFLEDGRHQRSNINGNGKVTAFNISKSGNYAVTGESDGSLHLIEYGSDEFIGVEKISNITGHNAELINAVAFSDDEKYVISQSKSFTRKWLINGTKPFVEMAKAPSMRDFEPKTETLNQEGFIYMDGSGDGPVWYCNEKGDTLAQFKALKYCMLENVSKNGKYRATQNGLFNSKNEHLIEFNIQPGYDKEIQLCGFSTDDKYYFAINTIYYLDAEEILKRYNTKFGDLEPFTAEEKKRYLIVDLKNSKVK